MSERRIATSVQVILLLALTVWPSACASEAASANETVATLRQPVYWPRDEIAAALSYIRLTNADLSLRSDYVRRDSCRLTGVDLLMQDPAEVPALLVSAAKFAFSGSRNETPVNAREQLQLRRLASLPLGGEQVLNAPLHEMRRDEETSAEPILPRGVLVSSPQWREYVGILEGALSSTGWADSVLGELSSDDRRFVMEFLPELILEDESDKDKPPEVLDSLQKLEDGYAERFAAMAGNIRWQWVYRHGVPRVEALLRSLPAQPPTAVSRRIDRDAPETYSTPFGDVILGTHGEDHYRGPAAVVIDPGGDDRYELAPLPIGEHRLIIDYAGDDDYRALEGHDLGAARFGWSALIDVAGNDLYRAGNFSLGAGWFGIGILMDLDGRDLYSGDIFTQGAGAFGIGVLYDGGLQADQFTGRLFAQGFGFAAGLGVLADAGGNDVYTAGGKYEDVLRYRDHYLSLSQGFGYGMRPHFSGGIGLLLDDSGNDVYVADIFGQGCSYWWAFGGIYDGGGNDHYIAYQYAQGSATHLTAGCLLDISGDDRYESKGVSQGCGHDWAVALLVDAAGNDRYVATDLSQAAGSANGVGALIDFSGDDGYYVVSPRNTQGYGNPRREYGSVGLFLDLAGNDRYDGPGTEGTVWLGSSKWGVGVDADSTWLGTVDSIEVEGEH